MVFEKERRKKMVPTETKVGTEIILPSFDPITGRYAWIVDYDESIADKIEIKNPLSLASVSDYATDKKFPDDRKGKRVVTGRIWYPGRCISQNTLGGESGGTLARPKELIDFSRTFPRPALDGGMPLAAAGQFWVDADGDRFYLCLGLNDAGRGLIHVWLFPLSQWFAHWQFLVLDPPASG